MNANCPAAGWLHRVAAVAQGPVMTGIDEAWSGSFSFPEHILDILGSKETASGEPFSLQEVFAPRKCANRCLNGTESSNNEVPVGELKGQERPH